MNINNFRADAQKLGFNQVKGDVALRMREDGQGIATTKWERFKVGFVDLFRTQGRIEAMKIAVSQNFVEALQKKNYDTATISTNKPLTARTFISTVANLARPEVQEPLQAAKKQAAADFRFSKTFEMLTDPTVTYGANNFNSNLEAAFKELHVMAKEAGVADSEFNEFKNNPFDPEKNKNNFFQVHVMTGMLRLGLSEKYEGRKEEISSVEANKYCIDATKRYLTEKFNEFQVQKFNAENSKAASIDAAIEKQDKEFIARFKPNELRDWIGGSEAVAQKPEDKIISLNDRPKVREEAINKWLANAEKKRALVDKHFPPDFPKKESLLKLIAQSSVKMDDQFFTVGHDAIKNVYNNIGELDVGNLDQAVELLADVGKGVLAARVSARAEAFEDLTTLTEVGKYMFAANGGSQMIDEVRTKIFAQCNNDASELMNLLSKKRMNTENDESINKFNGALQVFALLTRRLD